MENPSRGAAKASKDRVPDCPSSMITPKEEGWLKQEQGGEEVALTERHY